MLLPSAEQYSKLIEEKDADNFSFLNDYSFLYKENSQGKEYCFNVGTCAAVFKAVKDAKPYAIRCFLRGELETFKRYEQLQNFLESKPLPWKVAFDFLNNEININGQWLPVVKMDWVEGMALNKFIDEIVLDHEALSLLQKKLVELSSSLEANSIGHGDLKYNNIYVQKQDNDFTLKLIDYDSMFIPAFTGKKNLEPGSPGFQHLKRLSTDFSDTIDRFSVWIMLTTLEAIKSDAGLWKAIGKDEYTNSENSLFTVSDFIHPNTSKTFQKLNSYSNDALHYYLDKLREACSVRNLNAIPKPQIHAMPDVLKSPIPIEQSAWHKVDLSQREKESPPSQPLIEQDEILEFGADKYSIYEGERTTINWNVKGAGKIHISNMGHVQERAGMKKVVLSNTTNYVLTIGKKNKSFTVYVHPKPVQAIAPEPASPFLTTRPANHKIKRKYLRPALLVVLFAAASFYIINYTSKNKTTKISSAEINAALPQKPLFSATGITSFLQQLYSSYNNRNLDAILSHYAASVNEYYNSTSLTNDSLSVVIKNLFILPAHYQCTPDFTTLHYQPQQQNCKATITIHEKLKSSRNSKMDSFTTTIEYLIDPSYKIISERSVRK